MGLRGGKLGAPFKSWSEQCSKYRELLSVNAPLPPSGVTFKKSRGKKSIFLVGSWENNMTEGCQLLMIVVPTGTAFLDCGLLLSWPVLFYGYGSGLNLQFFLKIRP